MFIHRERKNCFLVGGENMQSVVLDQENDKLLVLPS